VAMLAAAVALGVVAGGGPVATTQAQSDQEQQQAPTDARAQPSKDDADDPAGPPIWAGIGLVLLAAAAGTLAARARNRRRMREYLDE
jgi:hypothetical protein